MQVFLDEVNTSSCLGLFKEIIVDRSSDGKVSSEYISIIILSGTVREPMHNVCIDIPIAY